MIAFVLSILMLANFGEGQDCHGGVWGGCNNDVWTRDCGWLGDCACCWKECRFPAKGQGEIQCPNGYKKRGDFNNKRCGGDCNRDHCCEVDRCNQGSNWSPNGNMPCQGCTQCEHYRSHCTATKDAVCGYEPACDQVSGYVCHEDVCNTNTDQGTDLNEGGCFDVESRAECVQACDADPMCTMFEFTADSNPSYALPRCCLEYCDLNICTNFDFGCTHWDLYVRRDVSDDCKFCRSWGDPHVLTFDGSRLDTHEVGDNVYLEVGDYKVIANQVEIPFNVAVNQDWRIEHNGEIIWTIHKGSCEYEVLNPGKMELTILPVLKSRSFYPTSLAEVPIWQYMIKLPGFDHISIYAGCDGMLKKWTNLGVKLCGDTSEVSGYCTETGVGAERRALMQESCPNQDSCCGIYVESGAWDLYDGCMTDTWFECCDMESGNLFIQDEHCCEWYVPSCLDGFECSPGEECDEQGVCEEVTIPDDCEGKWSAYTSDGPNTCNTDCGVGTMTRTYTHLQEATEGGVECPEEDGAEKTAECVDYSGCPMPISYCTTYGEPHVIRFDGKDVGIQRTGDFVVFAHDNIRVIEHHQDLPLGIFIIISPEGNVAYSNRARVEVDGQTVVTIDNGGCHAVSTNEAVAKVSNIEGHSGTHWASSQYPGHWKYAVTFPDKGNTVVLLDCGKTMFDTTCVYVGVKFMGPWQQETTGMCAGECQGGDWNCASAESAISSEAKVSAAVAVGTEPETGCAMLSTCCSRFIEGNEHVYNGCMMDALFDCCSSGADENCCAFMQDGVCDVDYKCGFGDCCNSKTGFCEECTACGDGTYNDLGGFQPCYPCSVCAGDIIHECTRFEDTICDVCKDDDGCLQDLEAFPMTALCSTQHESCATDDAMKQCCKKTCGLCDEFNALGMCTAPDNAETVAGEGKQCPDDAEGCLDPTAYEDFDDAWHACGVTPDCAYLTENDAGKFSIFREADPACTEGCKNRMTYNCDCVDGVNYSINGKVPCEECVVCDHYETECGATQEAECKDECTEGGTWSASGFSPCTGCTLCAIFSSECTPTEDATCETELTFDMDPDEVNPFVPVLVAPPPYFTITSGECDEWVTTTADCEAAAVYLELYGRKKQVYADRQNGARWDPPYCYKENGKVKFNDGSNTGPCKSKDICVCKQPAGGAVAAMIGLSQHKAIQVVPLAFLCFGVGYFAKIWMQRKDTASDYLLTEEEF